MVYCNNITSNSTEWAGEALYRVSQKFVPLVSCAITFDKNFYLTWNFWETFIAPSTTCIQNFSNQHSPLFFLSHSVAFGTWNRIERVEPQMIYFGLFHHLVRKSHSSILAPAPQTTFFFSLGNWKKIYFKHSSKNWKIIITAPILSNAFVPLYKIETSWSCLAD